MTEPTGMREVEQEIVMHKVHQASSNEVLVRMKAVFRKTSSRFVFWFFVILITLIFFIPFEWTFQGAFKSTKDIFDDAWPVTWRTFLPANPTLQNFYNIFVSWGFGRFMINSFYIAICQTVGTLIVSSLAAFGLTRLRFRFQDLLFALVMFVAFIPFEVVMVPLYVTVRSVGLINSYPALFLPWIANPFGIFLLRQAFMEIPRDFDESAIVDGANHFQIYWHIIIPNSKPALITLALMSFLWSWNSFFWPLIAMQDNAKQVIQVAIASFTLPYQLPAWGEIFAGATISTIPILIVFISLQRYYIKGAIMSGIKG
jgi:ABC-type glycerol-3-phosphate transport system permease component